jgi:enediyne biosynthesis protein E4
LIRTVSISLALLAVMSAQLKDAVRFVDIALQAGLEDVTYCGGERAKNYIVETLGTGAAFLDYDNDGDLDIFLVNASRLEGFPKGQEPTNHLYRNVGGGKFEDSTREAGLLRSGWGQGVCAGDIDNDGHTDLYVTYWGHDVLYRNTGHGAFEDLTQAAGMKTEAVRWGAGCAFFDFNKDGRLDLLVANYVQFDKENTPTPSMSNACRWKDMKVMCGPRALTRSGSHSRTYRSPPASQRPGSGTPCR